MTVTLSLLKLDKNINTEINKIDQDRGVLFSSFIDPDLKQNNENDINNPSINELFSDLNPELFEIEGIKSEDLEEENLSNLDFNPLLNPLYNIVSYLPSNIIQSSFGIENSEGDQLEGSEIELVNLSSDLGSIYGLQSDFELDNNIANLDNEFAEGDIEIKTNFNDLQEKLLKEQSQEETDKSIIRHTVEFDLKANENNGNILREDDEFLKNIQNNESQNKNLIKAENKFTNPKNLVLKASAKENNSLNINATLTPSGENIDNIRDNAENNFAEILKKSVLENNPENQEKSEISLPNQEDKKTDSNELNHASSGNFQARLLDLKDKNISSVNISKQESTSDSSPIEQAYIRINKALEANDSEVNFDLHPESLGKLNVRITKDKERTYIHIIVEKPDTLSLLNQDKKILEDKLQNIAIKSNNSELSFSLGKDSNNHQQSHSNQRYPAEEYEEYKELEDSPKKFETLRSMKEISHHRELDIKI